MPLWKSNIVNLQKCHWDSENIGSDCYLYSPGPSLADVTFPVNLPGTFSFVINTAYPKIRPNIWIGMDKVECYDYRLLYEAFPKVFRSAFSKKEYEGKPLNEYPSVYFVDVEVPQNGIIDIFESKKPNTYFAWFHHTLGVALHVMIWMGAKKIHFVGCDLGGKKDYYDDRVLDDTTHAYNRRLYLQQEVFLREFNSIAQKFGVECISCTDQSPINKFMPYVELSRALAISQSKIKNTHSVKHVLEIEQEEIKKATDRINWIENVHKKEGVLVMCDEKQQWLLDWWYTNFRLYNPGAQVQFVDIGMTETGIKFCKVRGIYTKMSDIPLKDWFKKPFAMKLTQFTRTLYMDLDCRVRGGLGDLFDEYKGFAISHDQMNNFSTVSNPVNSGVIIYDRKEKIIDRWCDNVIKMSEILRGDQDVLDHTDKIITELPHSVHHLRIMGDNDKALIYHYTGETGKEMIKNELANVTK
jgi:hypothetical protein